MIDGRHVSSVLNVCIFRGVPIDSDHYLVAAKIRMRICLSHKADSYNAQLSVMLNRTSSLPEHSIEIWAHISHSIKCAAEKTIGYEHAHRVKA